MPDSQHFLETICPFLPSGIPNEHVKLMGDSMKNLFASHIINKYLICLYYSTSIIAFKFSVSLAADFLPILQARHDTLEMYYSYHRLLFDEFFSATALCCFQICV